MIKKVKESYGSRMWFDGLDMMRNAKDKTSKESDLNKHNISSRMEARDVADWQLNVIFHKYLVDDYYNIDPSFDHKYFTYVKCNEAFPAEYNRAFGYRVIYESKFPLYNELLQFPSRPYMAVSAIYHIYKDGLYSAYDYVGFLEYDISLQLESNNKVTNITEQINETIKSHDSLIIPLSIRHRFNLFHGQIEIRIDNTNAMERILSDYNSFFGTRHKLADLITHNPLITGQQSFLADKETFERIMTFIAYIIEKKVVEGPNSWRRPSTLLDRYVGMSILLDETMKYIIPLKHHNHGQW